MRWLPMNPLLADFPAEILIWVVIGVVWAVVQVFAKINKDRIPPDSQDRSRPAQRSEPLTPSMEPVSPTDELRDFLRKISGERDREKDEGQASTQPRRREPSRPPPVPTAAHRPTTRQATADLRRREPTTPTRSPPLRSVPQRSPAMPLLQNRQRSGVPSSRITPPVPSKSGVPRRSLKSPTLRLPRTTGTSKKPGGFGNWRAAIVHREIIGPPRAMQPYSPNKF